MYIRLALLLFALTVIRPALACTCENDEGLKACELFHRTHVIFRGRVIDHNHDKSYWLAQITLDRFQVIEAYKGLHAGQTQVLIDTTSLAGCFAGFDSNRDYLVYAEGAAPSSSTLALLQGKQSSGARTPFPVPNAWRGLENLPVYPVGGCSPTRVVDADDPDIAFLRAAAKNALDTDGWIEGRVVQNFSRPFRFSEFVAVPGAEVTVVSSSGTRETAAVAEDGTYKIGPLSPGQYSISAQATAFGSSRFRGRTVSVPQGGCAVANLSFESRSTLSGQVRTAEGKPAPAIRVALGEVQSDGKVREVPTTWAETDEDGRFILDSVPSGRVVLAANLNRSPTADLPFDTVYAPGTLNLSEARVVVVPPGEHLTGVSLQLPEALPFGDLFVDVLWPDGSPALGGAAAFADWNSVRAAVEHAPKSENRVKLRLALGREYEVQAAWSGEIDGRRYRGNTSVPQTINFTESGQTIQIYLKDRHPR